MESEFIDSFSREYSSSSFETLSLENSSSKVVEISSGQDTHPWMVTTCLGLWGDGVLEEGFLSYQGISSDVYKASSLSSLGSVPQSHKVGLSLEGLS